MSLAKLVKAKRDREKLGLRDCAKKIGISCATICRIENGGVPDLVSFKKIVKWLGLYADYLLFEVMTDLEALVK